MPLTTPREMFARAYAEGFAVGGFNVNNMEIIQGIIETGKAEKSHVDEFLPRMFVESQNVLLLGRDQNDERLHFAAHKAVRQALVIIVLAPLDKIGRAHV